MKLHFRPTEPSDAPAVAEFLQRIFALDASLPLIDRHHLGWKSWESRSDWPGSRGYVLTKDDEIVAHATVIPLAYADGQRRLAMGHLIDWAADRKVVGAGVTLLKQITKLVDAILIVGGSDVAQKVLPALGFKTCGAVRKFVRPLRPWLQVTWQRPSLRAAARFSRSMLWSLSAPAIAAPGWTATRIATDAVTAEVTPLPCPSGDLAIMERTADLFAYWLKCMVPMELYAAAKNGVRRGYFLLGHVPGQARIVDFYVDSDTRDDWRDLIQLAIGEALHNQDAAEVVALGSDAMTRQALEDCGFHARGDAAIRILPRKGVALPTGAIRFQMIDNDAAYMHENKPSQWG